MLHGIQYLPVRLAERKEYLQHEVDFFGLGLVDGVNDPATINDALGVVLRRERPVAGFNPVGLLEVNDRSNMSKAPYPCVRVPVLCAAGEVPAAHMSDVYHESDRR